MGHTSALRTLRVLVAVSAPVVFPAAASAAESPRICVFGVKGEGGAALVDQLSSGLCDQFECVPADRVRSAGKLDFATVKAEGVDGVLFGTVTRGTRPRFALALLTTSFTPRQTWAVPLDARGRIAAASMAGLAADLRRTLGERPRPAPAPVVAPRPAPVAPVATVAPVAPSRPAPTPAAATAPAVSEVPAVASAAPAAAPAPVATAPLAGRSVRRAAVDVGFDVSHRDLSYSGVAPSAVAPLKVSASSIVSPAIRAEVLPLAGAEGAWWSGAVLFAAYSRSVGLDTEEPAGARATHSTTMSRLELGAGVRVWPLASSALSVTPRLSYRTFSVKVSPKNAIPGLPDVDLSGVRAGVDAEAPFGSRYALLGELGFTWWARAKDLVGSGGFFSSGSAWDLDASVGLSYEIRAPFSVRAFFDYARTSYSLSGTSAYRATGATDTLMGGRVLGRVVF